MILADHKRVGLLKDRLTQLPVFFVSAHTAAFQPSWLLGCTLDGIGKLKVLSQLEAS